MKILLDQNISAAIVGPLRDSGIGAIHTGETGLATAEDVDILAWCRHENRVAITREVDSRNSRPPRHQRLPTRARPITSTLARIEDYWQGSQNSQQDGEQGTTPHRRADPR